MISDFKAKSVARNGTKASEKIGGRGEGSATEDEAPEPVGSELAQTAMGRYLNNRAATIFGGSDEVQKNIIAKTVLGL